MSEDNSNKISFWAATIISMNAMVGAGIVFLPTLMSVKAGPAGIFSCIISVAIALFIGLSLGRVAELYPGKGWIYSYPSKWGGHWLGMLSAIFFSEMENFHF